jgi:hypothetical protein
MNGRVSALLATPAGLVAAGSLTSLGGTSQTGLAVFHPSRNRTHLSAATGVRKRRRRS